MATVTMSLQIAVGQHLTNKTRTEANGIAGRSEGDIAKPDYNQIKKEYISGGTSYRKLAAKYNIPFSNLKNIAIKEQWTHLREQAKNKTDTKMVNAISEKSAKIDDKYFRLVDKLMSKAEETIENLDVWSVTAIKEMSTALKYLKECKGVKSEADMREQEARIKNLEKQAQEKNQDDGKPSGIVLLPAIADKLIPPSEEEDDG